MTENKKANPSALKDNEGLRSDGRFFYRYTDSDSGKRVYIYAKDLKTLRAKEKEINKRIILGLDSVKADRITLNDLFNQYCESKKSIRETTLDSYKYYYTTYIVKTLGKKKVSEIKYSHLLSLYNNLLDTKLQIGTLKLIHNMIHPMFDIAVRDGLISSNPADMVLKEIRNTREFETKKRVGMSNEEQNAFINFIKTSPEYQVYLPLFTVLLGTGCRIGEVMGLTWKDIDFKNNIIHINHTLNYKVRGNDKAEFRIFQPKTQAGIRDIPMLSEVRQALLAQKEYNLAKGRCNVSVDGYTDFVFTNSRNHLHKPNTINRVMDSITRKYNQEERILAEKEKRTPLIINHYSVHNLRHTFCKNYCKIESNMKTIQTIMGHANISITQDVYNECSLEDEKASFEKLEGKFRIG